MDLSYVDKEIGMVLLVGFGLLALYMFVAHKKLAALVSDVEASLTTELAKVRTMLVTGAAKPAPMVDQTSASIPTSSL